MLILRIITVRILSSFLVKKEYFFLRGGNTVTEAEDIELKSSGVNFIELQNQREMINNRRGLQASQFWTAKPG